MDRMSGEFPRYESKAVHRASFEETWPRHEFAELVRLALAAGAWLVKIRRRMGGQRPAILDSALPGEMNPAE